MSVRDNTSFLSKLTSIPSPSGRETEATECFKNEVMDYLERGCMTDKFNNTWFSFGNGPKKILLSAHIDEVFAVVTSISDDGMVSIGPAGGVDKKDLPASKV